MALNTLCDTAQLFLGLLVLLAFLAVVLAGLLYLIKKDKHMLAFAKYALVAFIILAALYVLAVPLLNQVAGKTACPPSVTPYCGREYCSNAQAGQMPANCTCIQY